MVNPTDIIESGEYEYYGVRAHRSAAVVGETLGSSRIWVDGECTDDELDGISAIAINDAADLDVVIARLRREYCWDNEQIVLVGGNYREWGEDAGEIIIRDNVCLAVLA